MIKNKTRFRISLPALALLLAPSVGLAQMPQRHRRPVMPRPARRVLYVDGSATGLGTGSSWTDAFSHPQEALGVARRGTDIWVARGTYDPDPSTLPPYTKTVTFRIPPGVRMYGGFTGGESSAKQRDPLANPTVLTGDQIGDDVYGPAFNLGSDNVDHIVTMQAATRSTRLDGFQIIGAFNKQGPGLNLISGSPTIANCEFSWCAALDGGGVYAAGAGAPEFIGCSFHDCFASLGTGGGAIYFEAGATPRLINCTFIDNHAPGGNGAGLGAVYCDAGTNLTVDGCTFQNNTAKSGGAIAFFGPQLQVTNCFFVGNSVSFQGGAVFNSVGQVTVGGSSFSNNSSQFGGGALQNASGALTILSSTFTQNTSVFGGGVVENAGGTLTVEDCSFLGNFGSLGGAIHAGGTCLARSSLFCSNQAANGGAINGDVGALMLAIRSCVFVGNMATKDGGAVNSQGGLSMLGCTVYNNQALDHRGGVSGVPTDSVSGCILWANHDGVFGSIGRSQVHGVSVSYCCVQNLLVGPPGEDPPNPSMFPGSIDQDPLFNNPVALDFNLQAISPCIDAGDNTTWPASETMDFDGGPRFVDIASVPDTGLGTAPIVDMGAQEVP